MFVDILGRRFEGLFVGTPGARVVVAVSVVVVVIQTEVAAVAGIVVDVAGEVVVVERGIVDNGPVVSVGIPVAIVVVIVAVVEVDVGEVDLPGEFALDGVAVVVLVDFYACATGVAALVETDDGVVGACATAPVVVVTVVVVLVHGAAPCAVEGKGNHFVGVATCQCKCGHQHEDVKTDFFHNCNVFVGLMVQSYGFFLTAGADLSYLWIGISLILPFLAELRVDLQLTGDDERDDTGRDDDEEECGVAHRLLQGTGEESGNHH